jgi:hypothetical protein
MLSAHLHLHFAFTRRTNRRSLGTFQKVLEIGERWMEKYFQLHFKGFISVLIPLYYMFTSHFRISTCKPVLVFTALTPLVTSVSRTTLQMVLAVCAQL